MAKWIEEAAKAARPKERELDARHAAAALSEHRAARLDAEKVAQAPKISKPRLKPHPDDYPSAASCTIKGELKRFPTSRPISLHSPIMGLLISDGYVTRVYDPSPPGLCLGFQLTDKGRSAR